MEQRINNLEYKYPIESHTKMFLDPNLDYKKYMSQTKILLPPNFLELLNDFIINKQIHGTLCEKNIYENMVPDSLIKRLSTKKPLMFMGKGDFWYLKNGKKGLGNWNPESGTNNDLDLDNYLSYDEMELSALISLSISTPFINNGARNNCGRCGSPGSFEKEGIVIGQVGARFEEFNKMEWRYVIIDPIQNVSKNGYGPQDVGCETISEKIYNEDDEKLPGLIKKQYLKIFEKFYDEEYFITYNELQKRLFNEAYQNRYLQIPGYINVYLDTHIYIKRIEIVAKIFLDECNERASKIKLKAFCYVMGLGLGAWKITDIQKDLYIEAFMNIINKYDYEHISDIYFGYIRPFSEEYKCKNISIKFGHRTMFEPLNDDSKILISNWAWDSNSYIGNEYWIHNLSTSMDPATACASFIAYIGNPDLNDYLFQ